MKIGRPAKYKNSNDLLKKVQEYVDECREETFEPLTITGVCLYCGFESRQSFYAYEKKEEFSYAIKSIHLLIENSYELILHSKSYSGAIFALKNLGWADTQHIDHTTGGEPLGFQIEIKDAGKDKAK